MAVIHSHSSKTIWKSSWIFKKENVPNWEKCAVTSVNWDTAYLRVGGSLPVVMDRSPLFSVFPPAYGHAVSLFPGSQQFVVGMAVAVFLSVLPDQGTKFWMSSTDVSESNYLSWEGARWLSYWRSQPLLSLGSSLNNYSVVLPLDLGERFAWLSEGTTVSKW